jgi:hypothetical protein
MLTIENYHKLNHRDIADDWAVKYIYEGTHNDTYIVNLEKWVDGIKQDKCSIMLERNPIAQHSSTHPTELAYFFIFDSQRTNVCVTADWISDIDNMVGQLKYLLQDNGKIPYV